MVRRFILGAMIVAGLAVAGATIYFQKGKNEAVAAAPSDGESAAPAAPVAVMTIEPKTISLTHALPGRVSPFRQAQIRPQVDGIITERLFEEGAEVKKGDQLYQIDDARFAAALNSALADLKSAEANLKAVEARVARYAELVKIKAVSQQEYDDAKAALDQAQAGIAVAQAAVDVAQVNLDFTKVYAPIDGRIGKSLVTEGALVTANQAHHLAVITQLDPVFVDMQQSGNEMARLRERLSGVHIEIPVEIAMENGDTAPYPRKGALKFSEVTVDETTGSIALRALVPNPESFLLPGLFVRATLELGEEEVLLVPQRATIRNPDGSLHVWVVDADNKAQKRPIHAAFAHGNQWVVDEGINAGDSVIVQGYQRIGEGAAVNPSQWEETQ
ncbi:MAG: efflux RND transporter periplasmic adaptor subunit [Alphaproteobacteria bacterium]